MAATASPPNEQGRPRSPAGSGPNAQNAIITTASITAPADSARELGAWQQAVEHLLAAGLAAAVPELAARQLRRRGVTASWSYAPRRAA